MKRTFETVNLVADPYPPYQYEEGGVVIGIDHDIITAAFNEFDVETRVQLFPWEDCLDSVKNKRADGIFQIVRTPERVKAFLFSRSFRTAETALFCNACDPIVFNKKKDLKVQLEGRVLGVLEGYSYDPMIDSLKGPGKKEVERQEMLLTGLLEGGFDLVIMDLGVAEYLMDKMKLGGIVRVDGFEISRELHVAFQKDLPELKDHFNLGLLKIKEKGIYQKIYHMYGMDYLKFVSFPN